MSFVNDTFCDDFNCNGGLEESADFASYEAMEAIAQEEGWTSGHLAAALPLSAQADYGDLPY